ncbi:hypothetical protein GCM10009810_10960 [Nostocoides vanveenii]|uniref:Uncharacterized protein n=1 Tax=Nostocoides vanveenii TaxID=330835 RepID=A0ABP4WJC6_9MICO
MDAEVQSLLTACGLDHDRATVLAEFDDPIPELIANATGEVTDEDSRGDLQKPSGEVSAEAGGHGRHNEHYHGASSEKFWPQTTFVPFRSQR